MTCFEDQLAAVRRLVAASRVGGGWLVGPDQFLEQIDSIKPRMFPIQDGPSIPWSVIEPFDFQCQRNHGRQTLERIAERGGLSVLEAIAVLQAREWDRDFQMLPLVIECQKAERKIEAILILQGIVASRLEATSQLGAVNELVGICQWIEKTFDMGADRSQVADPAIIARRDIYAGILARIVELKEGA